MLFNHLLSEANRLLEEVEQGETNDQTLDFWEASYSAYKDLIKEAPDGFPTSVKFNLPYIGMGIQIAKKVNRDGSRAFYLKHAKNKFVNDLKSIIATYSPAEQAA